MEMEELKYFEVEIINTSSANNPKKVAYKIINPEDDEIENLQQKWQQSQVKSESSDELQDFK